MGNLDILYFADVHDHIFSSTSELYLLHCHMQYECHMQCQFNMQSSCSEIFDQTWSRFLCTGWQRVWCLTRVWYFIYSSFLTEITCDGSVLVSLGSNASTSARVAADSFSNFNASRFASTVALSCSSLAFYFFIYFCKHHLGMCCFCWGSSFSAALATSKERSSFFAFVLFSLNVSSCTRWSMAFSFYIFCFPSMYYK